MIKNLSRRRFLQHAITGMALAMTSHAFTAGRGNKPDPLAGVCDTHTHVFLDPARYPMAPDRHYTPPMARVADLVRWHERAGIDRVVLVQPSVYGTDNSAMVDALRELGPDRARGVAVLGDDADDYELRALDKNGVRGLRLNLVSQQVGAEVVVSRLNTLADRLAALGWHLQLYVEHSMLAALVPTLVTLSVPVVIDHFGRLKTPKEGKVPAERLHVMDDLLASGNVYVKLSAPYHLSKRAPAYKDLKPLARYLLEQHPQRVLWGSNWPHPGRKYFKRLDRVSPFKKVDSLALRELVAKWVPDHASRKALLVDNPARLYGF